MRGQYLTQANWDAMRKRAGPGAAPRPPAYNVANPQNVQRLPGHDLVGSFRRWNLQYQSRMPDASKPQTFRTGSAGRGTFYAEQLRESVMPDLLTSRLKSSQVHRATKVSATMVDELQTKTAAWVQTLKDRNRRGLSGLGQNNEEAVEILAFAKKLNPFIASFESAAVKRWKQIYDVVRDIINAYGHGPNLDTMSAMQMLAENNPPLVALNDFAFNMQKTAGEAKAFTQWVIANQKPDQEVDPEIMSWYRKVKPKFDELLAATSPDERKSMGLGAAGPVVILLVIAVVIAVAGAAAIGSGIVLKDIIAQWQGGSGGVEGATSILAFLDRDKNLPPELKDKMKTATYAALIQQMDKIIAGPQGLASSLGTFVLVGVAAWAIYKVFVGSGFGQAFGASLGRRLGGGGGGESKGADVLMLDAGKSGGGGKKRKRKRRFAAGSGAPLIGYQRP